MQKLYSLKIRRIIYTYYNLNKYIKNRNLRFIYQFIKCENYITRQLWVWLRVYLLVEYKSMLLRKFSWICLVTGRYRGIYRLFMMSRLTILNQITITNWNSIFNNTK